MPPVDSRTRDGFVGLKNGGATCYMNSLLQQLYMTPGIPEYLLAMEDEQVDEERSVFCEWRNIALVYSHLETPKGMSDML